jgi:predicted adenine nucleotide alpha hydrolase (AANH) superfamily ATPase
MILPEQRSVLLHVCCAPCSTAVIERLAREGYDLTLLFSNSNIHPVEEYEKRLGEARRFAEMQELELLEDAYDHSAWLDHIKGYEKEPERGARCLKCFEYNLGKTASRAQEAGLGLFTTTLTVSRHKSSLDIFRIGSRFPGFLAMDFKKQDGYNRSLQISRGLSLYRQDYCGCEFSRSRGNNPNSP